MSEQQPLTYAEKGELLFCMTQLQEKLERDSITTTMEADAVAKKVADTVKKAVHSLDSTSIREGNHG